ncbi:hypothetical protein GCM10009608_79290 [Pseudonocardia alaniniphila]
MGNLHRHGDGIVNAYRAISAMTPLMGKALRAFVPTAEELDRGTQYVVDRTLLPYASNVRYRNS